LPKFHPTLLKFCQKKLLGDAAAFPSPTALGVIAFSDFVFSNPKVSQEYEE